MDSERSYVRRLIITVAVVALALLAWRLRVVLLLLFGAVLVAVILRSIADPISRLTRAPAKVALSAAVLALLAAGVGVSWLFGAETAAQIRTLSDTLPAAWRAVQQRFGDTWLSEQLNEWLEESQPAAGTILTEAGNVVLTFGSAVAGVLLVLMGGIYLAAAPRSYADGALDLIPQAKRPLLREALGDSGRALRLWLLGQLVSMVLIGVLTTVGLWWIGVPSAVALGPLAGLAEFIPYLGPILSAIPALLIASNEGTDVFLLT